MTPYSNNESPNLVAPTGSQLIELRRKQWHQNGESLLTFENVRSWINAAGLVLFLPRPQVIAEGPTFVEATLGSPNPTPTLAQIAQSRELLGRLVSDGLAVPLNLLGSMQGGAADTPDFVVSTSVFSYIFTLRGDKLWKQPPTSAGSMKVSNLAIAAYEAISRRGAASAYDLATELGKEVTETAVLRALSELWHHLRVIPLCQHDGAATLWELTTTRFTKQIKAGANAGQPSAISALVSLYLGQAVAASEDEIESFLSPLSPRSRIREVLHALLAARQLETISVDGRTVMHISGEAPVVTAPIPAAAPPAIEAESDAHAQHAEERSFTSDRRIQKFVPNRPKVGSGHLSKAKPAMGKRPVASDRFKSERERRPFDRSAAPRDRSAAPRDRSATPRDRSATSRDRREVPREGRETPRFDQPWKEGKPSRAGWKPARTSQNRSTERSEDSAPPRSRREKPVGDRPFHPGRKRPSGGFTPREENKRSGDRPPARRTSSGDFQSRPRKFAGDGKTFSSAKKDADRGRRGKFGDRERSAEPARGKRPFASDSSDKRPFGGPRRFSDKPGVSAEDRGKRKPFGEKTFRKSGPFTSARSAGRFGDKPNGRKPPSFKKRDTKKQDGGKTA